MFFQFELHSRFILKVSYGVHKLVAPVFIGVEEVETGATGREEYGVAISCCIGTGKDSIVEVMGAEEAFGGIGLFVPIDIAQCGEMLLQFLVMQPHKDEGVALVKH
jgi:hypothetical protein